MRNPTRSWGISLLELMIGIAIGMLVVIAALGTMSFTQATSSTLTDSTRLQQSADFVFRSMGFQATQAGAIALVAASEPSQVVFSNSFSGADPNTTGSNFLAAYGSDGAAIGTSGITQPDRLLLSYENDGNSRDCLGTSNATINHVDSTFYVSNGSLMCQSINSTTLPQSIADGVDDFQVWYGIQPSSGAYQFVTASNIGTLWGQVQAVRVCLVIRGERAGNPQPGLSQTGCQGQSLTADGYIRRVFWRTFTMRNKIL
ncbi:PilW family protein [Curvibacter sp. CHRR-16]|uniref:PilW family protein n=1 Tax=Curvibacter sp. CHRR-16 TaxID=2835872 RepID=UPI001BDB4AC8|nr:PilW family protein [Curvibacter sp. CHRR-16]MBT0569284.1 PilW family protein [Curvibacter sp. CHRR-16]